MSAGLFFSFAAVIAMFCAGAAWIVEINKRLSRIEKHLGLEPSEKETKP